MENKITRNKFVKLSLMGLTAPVFGVGCSGGKTGERETTADSTSTNAVAETTTSPVPNPYSRRTGIQLYSVRDAFDADPEGTLKKVAAIGYKELELPNYIHLEHLPLIQDLGMKVVSMHFSGDPVEGLMKDNGDTTYKEIVEACATAGVPELVIAIYRGGEGLDPYKRLAEAANKAGEYSKTAGVQLSYHNHNFEFAPVENSSPMDVMYEGFEKDLVKIELDLFWVKVSGNDPVETMKKYKDGLRLLHLKDVKEGTPSKLELGADPGAFQPVGDGIMDFQRILETAHELDVKYAFVEQDQSPEKDIFESIDRSYKYLQSLGL